MNLAAVVNSFATGTYTVTRREKSTYTKGRDGPSVTSSFLAKLCVTPLTGDDLLRMPEGMRSEEALRIYSPVELRGIHASGEPDSISVDGREYEVQSVERWDKLGGFWSVVVSRIRRT